MAIKDSIANLRKALRTTQTNAPAVIDTLIRGLDGVEREVEKGEVYTTDEQEVGTWIDGATIYRKVITFESQVAILYNDFTELTINTSTIATIIKCEGIHANGAYMGAFMADPNRAEHTKLGVQTPRNEANSNIKILILEYTKASTTRSPENDTKNDRDEEKNTDER